jgi:hypothetical protein
LPTGVPGGSTITVSYGHDDSDQLRVGSPREGVRRPPPLNRPMRRERRPPSWMRRRR